MKTNIRYTVFFLAAFFSVFALQAQDSTKKATEPSQAPSVSPNTTTTVPPVFIPESQVTVKPRRRKKLSSADSARLAARRDSIQNAQAVTAPQSAFNIGTPTLPQTPIATPSSSVPQPIAPTQPDVPNLQKSDNPFDILRGGIVASTDSNQSATTPTAATIQNNSSQPEAGLLNKKAYTNNFLLWIFLGTLILMAFVVANARGAIFNSYTTLMSASALRQIHKDPVGWGNFPYLALYTLFWINAGILAYLSIPLLGLRSPYGQLTTFSICVLGVSAVFLTKHAVLYIIAHTFPIGKEVKTYNFIMLNVGILLGLILMPLNIFIAYSPSGINQVFVYAALFIIAIFYIVRALRGLTIATPFLIENRFHFLLYLCAVEIAPLFILMRLLSSQS